MIREWTLWNGKSFDTREACAVIPKTPIGISLHAGWERGLVIYLANLLLVPGIESVTCNLVVAAVGGVCVVSVVVQGRVGGQEGPDQASSEVNKKETRMGGVCLGL